MSAAPTVDRILGRCIETGSGCWQYTAARAANGYVRTGGGYAHRLTYEFFVAEIPAGLEIDHLCRNRACCNPWHLEPVTHAVNVSRSLAYNANATKTHCKRGHAFDEENTYRYSRGRACRTCVRQRQARVYREARA